MTLYNLFNFLKLKFPLLFVLVLIHSSNIKSQTQKIMTPAVYSEWNKIKNIKISDSADVIVYSLEKEVGDKKMAIYNKSNGETIFFDRMKNYQIDPLGQYVVFSRELSYDSTRVLKRKKTETGKFPKDSLVIFQVSTKEMTIIPSIEEFKMPEKYSGFVFYTQKENKNDMATSTTSEGDKDENEKPIVKANTKKNPCDFPQLIIRQTQSGAEDTIIRIKDYVFAEDSTLLSYCQCSGDSIAKYAVYIKDLNTGVSRLLIDNLNDVTQMSFNKKGTKFAFLSLDNKSDAKQKPYKLFFKNVTDTSATSLNQKINKIKPKDWVISGDKAITWSESGKNMFFGISPVLAVRDTSILDDEIVNVEIWHHDSPRLFTMQESTLENDRKKAYSCVYDTDTDKLIQLETPEADRALLSMKGDGKYALQIGSTQYQKEITWLGESRRDITLINLESGEKSLIITGEFGNPSFSPTGRYIYWWNRNDSIWKSFDTEKFILGTLGLWSMTRFHDEENDVPQFAGPYGVAGWMSNDSAVVIYDRYDLWKIDPTNPFTYEQMTDGRSKKQVHRWIKTDPESDFIDISDDILLHRFDEKTKATAYVHLDLNTLSDNTLLSGDFSLTANVRKAKKSTDLIYTAESFDVFPDLIMTNDHFTTSTKISNANPQQSEYGWGKAELFSWTNYSNQRNDGMLFFPPNFDPEKKYPLIVNFYERSSDDIHRHRAPEAHRSTINYSYYTNKGYIIFNPDIKYTTGQPGDDCVNAVESGVDALLKTGYIDTERIALQGHSWGGYQVAYLLTKSERYKCAESGAPVVNMVSAYGGIRWESGLSRMFQYEKTQSRLGATLWENPKLYHKNSPIYEMTNVTTPVLIMHNDEDGAVPWYQSIEYYMALRRLNKPCWLLNYNNEPHWPVKWQNRLDFNIRMEQFFDHFLMDTPMPLWMKEGNTPLEKGILNKY